jgi:hypothetical protein
MGNHAIIGFHLRVEEQVKLLSKELIVGRVIPPSKNRMAGRGTLLILVSFSQEILDFKNVLS